MHLLPLLALPTTMMYLLNLLTRFLSTGPLFPSHLHHHSHKPPLRLDENNEFHITIFSDLHYGEEEDGFGIAQDVNSTRVLNRVLGVEKPDLVVLNGDLITGENTFLTNATSYLSTIVAPLQQHNTPWASTYGNHDSQFNLSRRALFGKESEFALSYTSTTPGVEGVTNYYLLVYPNAVQDGKRVRVGVDNGVKPLAVLYFFDSRGGAPFQAPAPPDGPNWVGENAVAWFVKLQASLEKKYGELPSLAFVHIPPSPFLAIQQDTLPDAGRESGRTPGLNDDVPLAAQGDGMGGQDGAFVRALRSAGERGLHSVYSGHDHGDSWCGVWPGVGNDTSSASADGGRTAGGKAPFLCFGKHSGYGGYGTWNRGARNLKLRFGQGVVDSDVEGKRHMEVETWIRMENGEVVQRVSLNETYGLDIYPLEDGES